MPYRRRRFKRTYRRGRGRYGRYRRKRNYARGRRAVKVYAMRQSARKYRFRKAIQRALNVEQKFHRLHMTAFDNTDGSLVLSDCANLIHRGAGPGERIGSHVAINSIAFTGWIHPNFYVLSDTQLPTAGEYPVSAGTSEIAVELWVDTQPEAGAITSIAPLYDSAGAGSTSFTAFRNRDNTSRYRKLKTLKWNLRPSAISDSYELDGSGNVDQIRHTIAFTGGGTRKSRISFKKPLVVKFDPSDDATAEVTKIMNRNLFVIMRRKYVQPGIDYAVAVQLNYTDV